MKQICKLIQLFSIIAIFAGVGAKVSHAETELARVNKSVISLEEFKRAYQDNLGFFQLKQGSKNELLQAMISREVGVQEAKRLGLDRDPEFVKRMNTLLYHFLTEKKLSKSFEAIQVTDGEAKDYYSRNPEIRTSNIYVALAPTANAQQQKDAMERMKKISEQLSDQKMSFAEVAQRFSEGPAAPVGGDIDFQTRERLNPIYYQAALRLGVGKTSGIIRCPDGLYLIKVTAIRPFEEQDKAQVKKAVFEEKRAKIFEQYIADLKSKAQIVTHTDLIKN